MGALSRKTKSDLRIALDNMAGANYFGVIALKQFHLGVAFGVLIKAQTESDEEYAAIRRATDLVARKRFNHSRLEILREAERSINNEF